MNIVLGGIWMIRLASVELKKALIGTCLHVVSKFEIRNEAQRLCPVYCENLKAKIHGIALHGDITISLEDHQSEWSTRLDISEDELSEHVQANLGIGDGLDNTNRQREDQGDSQRKEESPPC